MKKITKGYLLGFLSAAILTSGAVYAANTTTLYDVLMSGIKIVVDGHKLNPTDANGKTVEPIIYNGTTYLPVRAVADAFGKAVSWDGTNFTVYLGNMEGNLEYPTEELSTDGNIGDEWYDTKDLKDNLGKIYSRGIDTYSGGNTFEKLLNMKYSRFKGTFYVQNGTSTDETVQFSIKTDGKTVYTSPEFTKTSQPVDFDINITGCYDFQIICNGSYSWNNNWVKIGDAGFYQ